MPDRYTKQVRCWRNCLPLLLSALTAVAELVGWMLSDSQALAAGATHLTLDVVSRTAHWGTHAPTKRVRPRQLVVAACCLGGAMLLSLALLVVMLGPHRIHHPAPVEAGWLLYIAPWGVLAAVLNGRAETSRAWPISRDGLLSIVAALSVLGAALGLVLGGDARIDSMVSMLVVILLVPRLIIAISEF